MRFLRASLFLISTSLFAQTTSYPTRIEAIDYPTETDKFALVYLGSGKIVKILRGDAPLLKKAQDLLDAGSAVEVSFNNERQLLSLTDLGPAKPSALRTLNPSLLQGYTPTLLSDLLSAKKLFFDHRSPKNGETQCYNRAQVWTYEWRLKQKIYSKKIWLFFTRKYIRTYDFEWWFHVSPLVNVNIDGTVKERVMDMKYARGPLTVKQWTDIFMRDRADCPVVDKYSDHADYPESSTCFIQKSPMYYYRPLDLQLQERFETERSGWVISEVRSAYAEAFDLNARLTGDL